MEHRITTIPILSNAAAVTLAVDTPQYSTIFDFNDLDAEYGVMSLDITTTGDGTLEIVLLQSNIYDGTFVLPSGKSVIVSAQAAGHVIYETSPVKTRYFQFKFTAATDTVLVAQNACVLAA